MGKYLLNKETGKMELHFDKSEYMALSEELKSEIKSACLWSSKAGAWVSRSTNDYYRVKKVIEKLNLEDGGKIGERLSYAEQLERKAERAEERAERYEEYSQNAEKRAVNLQADFNKYRKDWSWLTQPIIAGHSGSRAFANHRNKVMARYERGFEEYEKSEYYQDRAATARATADNVKLKDKVYLSNKIKECNKNIKNYQDRIVKNEEILYRIQDGETLRNYSKEIITVEMTENRISELLEDYEYEQDKLMFFEKCLSELGGIEFSKDNIKIGYIVNIKGSGKCEIVSAGTENIKYKILEGGAAGFVLTTPYAAITEIISIQEIPKITNPYNVGEILCRYNVAGDYIINAYQIIKTTETGVKLQKIKVENNIPLKGVFEDEKPMQKKVIKSKYSDFVGCYDDDWCLYKYELKQA